MPATPLHHPSTSQPYHPSKVAHLDSSSTELNTSVTPFHLHRTAAMADREQPYDPYIPSGGANNANAGGAGQNGNHRTAALQAVGFDMHFRYERHCGVFVGLDGHCDTFNVLRRLNDLATAITLPHNVFTHTPGPSSKPLSNAELHCC